MAGERAVREMPRQTRPPDAPLTARGPHKTAQPKRRLGKKKDVGVRLGVSDDSVDRYERAGQLPIVVRLPSGRKRYDLEALDRLIDDWKAESR